MIPSSCCSPGKSVWIYAQVYEYEAPLVKQGQTMVVTSPALPGERFTTEILAIDPILDPMTRTTRVRGLVSTPDATLRPESFVDVTIHVPLGEQLAVPEDAVLDTGEHQLVFVVKDDGTFEPRAVELGREAEGYYEVRSGLSRGRAGRHVGELPHRLGVALSGRARRLQTRASARRAEVTCPMVERIIEFSAKNRGLVLLLTAVAVLGAVWTTKHIPLDAIPDLSDTQVIIYSRWDRSPDILEDQVTYPIATALLGAPRIKAVRGFSDFGYSYVYVIFEDGTDLYWARSRVLEYLSKILPRLPEGVRTEIGPDATSVGWVYQYALVDHSGTQSLADLRSLQDWYLRYNLQSVPGVAEVAAVGGFVKQYQVNADPNRLLAYNIPLGRARRCDPQRQQGGRGPSPRVCRHRVHGPRPRLRSDARGPREHRRGDGRQDGDARFS